MNRIALFNIECSATGEAINQILTRYSKNIRLVITSDLYKGRQGGFWRQLWVNYQRSGPAFLLYLSYNFLLHHWMLHLSKVWSKVTGRRPKQESLNNLCHKLQIPYLKVGDINSPEVRKKLKELSIDVVAIYYFDQILRNETIQAVPHGVVNFHPALLPKCRGLFPILFSALKNQRCFGMTAHDILDKSIDAGPILAQETVKMSAGECDEKSILFLERQVNNRGVELFAKVFSQLPQLRAKKDSQDESQSSYFSYPHSLDIKDLSKEGIRLTNFGEFLKGYF